MAAMVRDQPEAEEDLPEMDRDLRDSDLPATDRGQHPATDRREFCQAACCQEEKKGYHLRCRDRGYPDHGSSTVSGNDPHK